MTPSIYDYHDNEIAAARQIRRERRREIATAIVGAPLLVVVFIVLDVLMSI